MHQTFNDEIRHVLNEKQQLRQSIKSHLGLNDKLLQIMIRQELDTYDPNISLPKSYLGYFRYVNEFLKRDSLYKCADCGRKTIMEGIGT